MTLKRYLKERVTLEYPEFEDVTDLGCVKVDSPSKEHLKICNKVERSYCSCSYLTGAYYITIDNYLGKYKIGKRITLNKRFFYPAIFGLFSILSIAIFQNLMRIEQPQPFETPIEPITIPIPINKIN
jgi:hypothetical protein